MESSTAATPAAGRAVDAPTIAEAFRRTVQAHRTASRSARSAVRRHGRGGSCRSASTTSPAVSCGSASATATRWRSCSSTGRSSTSSTSPRRRSAPRRSRSTRATRRARSPTSSPTRGRGSSSPSRRSSRACSRRARRCPTLEHVIVIDGEAPDGCLDLVDVEGTNPSFDAEAHWRSVSPDDVLTLIYTSGTTGPPKGVQLSHRNLIAAVQAIEQLVEFPDGARVISWLPAAHIAERAAHHYLPLVFGFCVTSCPDPQQVIMYLSDVRPSWFFGGAPHLGEAEVRPRGDDRPAARRRACARTRRDRGGDQEGAPRAGRRGRAGRSRARRREGRRGDLRRTSASSSASTRSPPSTSAPRRRRAR